MVVALQLVGELNEFGAEQPAHSPLRLVACVGTPRAREVLQGLCASSGTHPSTPLLVTETLLQDQLTTGLLGQVRRCV
jgi:hypothetical protein